jgi:hypothetical protein
MHRANFSAVIEQIIQHIRLTNGRVRMEHVISIMVIGALRYFSFPHRVHLPARAGIQTSPGAIIGEECGGRDPTELK